MHRNNQSTQNVWYPWPLSNNLSSKPLSVYKVNGVRSLISSAVFGLKSFWNANVMKTGSTSDSYGSKHYGKHWINQKPFGLKGQRAFLALEDWQHSKGQCLWSSDEVRDNQQIIKRKKKKKSSQHNSSLVHCTGTGLCNPAQWGTAWFSCKACVKLFFGSFFGFAISDNDCVNRATSLQNTGKCIKSNEHTYISKLPSGCRHCSTGNTKYWKGFPKAVWPRPGSRSDISTY